MVSSRVYPSLERKPGGPDNWVERAGGLPSYIERIAKHLHYEKGKSISHSIAAAVNTVKRWAKGGTVTKYGTTKRISPATQAKAAAAVAEWEAKKKAGRLNLSEDVFNLVDMLERIDLSEGLYDEFLDLAGNQKCSMCSQPATKKVIWADGRAYQASCNKHVKAVQKRLTAKNGRMTELSGVQDLSDADISATDTMVALIPDSATASKIAVDGGVPVEDIHVTVLFYGELDDAAHGELVAKVQEYAAGWSVGPLKGTIGGIGSFPPSDSGTGQPWWVPVDVPGINTLHEQLKTATEGAKEDHGYSPHLTLTYQQEGDEPPKPVESIPVTFKSIWVVRGNTQRDEINLGAGAGAESTDRAILSADSVDIPKGGMNIQDLADRANAISDPVARAAARQSVLDLASTIPPRNARGRVSDGRRSFAGQGKFKHGFIPVNKAAKEAKAKGSPIAMKRMNRLFGKDKVKDDAVTSKREITTGAAAKATRKAGQTRKTRREFIKAATGRTGNRSAPDKSNPKAGSQIDVDEGKAGNSEKANSLGQLRNSSKDFSTNRSDKKAETTRKEANKESRVPARAKQNWDEIPDNLKTLRNGVRYVLAEFGGKGFVTPWVGGVDHVTETAAKDRKVMSSLATADAANMSQSELRALVNNPRTPDRVKKIANKRLRTRAKEPSRG